MEQESRTKLYTLPIHTRCAGSRQLVAVDQARARCNKFQQFCATPFDVVLAVAIGVEDDLWSLGKAAARRRRTRDFCWCDHAQVGRIQGAQFLQHSPGIVVLPSLIDDFVIGDPLTQHRERPGNQPGQRRSIVIRGEKYAQRREFRLTHSYTIFSPITIRLCPRGKPPPAPIHAASKASGA